MYQRDVHVIPIEILRDEFVNIIFDIGLEYYFGYDTLITAVEIGDKYVNFDHQYYSDELAHAVIVIASKANEDDHYTSLNAKIDTNNGYVISLEWKVCEILGFHIKNNNFITFICKFLNPLTKPTLGSVFWDLSKDICMNPKLLSMDPLVILTVCILLNKIGKLRAIQNNKKRVFSTIMDQISFEYDININDLLKKYIEIKQIINI